jgi:hypothetical protein
LFQVAYNIAGNTLSGRPRNSLKNLCFIRAFRARCYQATSIWHALGIVRSGRRLDTGVRKDERQSKGLKQLRAGWFYE